MNMIQAAANRRRQRGDHDDSDASNSSPTHGGSGYHSGSPVKSMLGALARPKSDISSFNPNKRSKKKKLDKLDVLPPNSVEEVPFRRQDRRDLNSRKKRVMDRKLIRFILLLGVLLIIAGISLIVVWWQFNEDDSLIGTFVIVGGVLVAFGVAVLLFSIEVIIRLRKNVKRVKDPEIDKITNLHQIKHWMPPELIPYGWGHNAMLATVREESELASSRGGATVVLLGGSCSSIDAGANKRTGSPKTASNTVHPGGSVGQIGQTGPGDDDTFDPDNPHKALVMREMSKSRSEPSAALRPGAAPLADPDDADIPSDIFDESLRYSNVDRPSLLIEPSSPTREAGQLRGDFQTEEDRIAQLFSPSKKK